MSNDLCSTVQGEVCHVLFIAFVLYTPSIEIASTPAVGSIVLPTCPVCIGELGVNLLIWLSATQYMSIWLWKSRCQGSIRFFLAITQ
jgi:hypothetical protein